MKPPRTLHTLRRNNKIVGMVETDTIFIDGIPHLVFEWTAEGDRPLHTHPVPLDIRYFHELNWESCKYTYELPVDDPRKLH